MASPSASLKPQSPPSSPPYVTSSSSVNSPPAHGMSFARSVKLNGPSGSKTVLQFLESSSAASSALAAAAAGAGSSPSSRASIIFSPEKPGAPLKPGCLALKGTYVFGEIDGVQQTLEKMDFYNVLAIFQKLSSEGDGCTIEQVAACAAELPSSNHMSKEKILIITKELELDGHIYSTLNDCTFKTTGPLAQPAEPAPHEEDEGEEDEGEDEDEEDEGEDEDEDEDEDEAEDEEDEEDLMQRIKKLSQENAALKKQRDELMQAHVEKNKWFSKLLKGFKKFKEVVAVAAEDAKDDYDTSDEAEEEVESSKTKKRSRKA